MAFLPPAAENSALVRYGFAAVFIVACLYRLDWGVRFAGAFLIGMGFYEGLMGRVPMTGWCWQTSGYLKGPAAMALCVVVIAAGAFLLLAPGVVIGLLAAAH